MYLQQQLLQQKVALEQQACNLEMEYQQARMRDEWNRQQAEMQKEMQSVQQRMHTELSEHQQQAVALQLQHQQQAQQFQQMQIQHAQAVAAQQVQAPGTAPGVPTMVQCAAPVYTAASTAPPGTVTALPAQYTTAQYTAAAQHPGLTARYGTPQVVHSMPCGARPSEGSFTTAAAVSEPVVQPGGGIAPMTYVLQAPSANGNVPPSAAHYAQTTVQQAYGQPQQVYAAPVTVQGGMATAAAAGTGVSAHSSTAFSAAAPPDDAARHRQSGQPVFDIIDQNHDGFITRQEWQQAVGPQ